MSRLPWLLQFPPQPDGPQSMDARYMGDDGDLFGGHSYAQATDSRLAEFGVEPCIAGTRIPIGAIVAFAGAGYTVDGIHHEFPSLSVEQIVAVLERPPAVDYEVRAIIPAAKLRLGAVGRLWRAVVGNPWRTVCFGLFAASYIFAALVWLEVFVG